MKMISPSMMCVDFLDIKDTLKTFEESGIEYLHIDIMDGEFVPNFTLGTDFCKVIKKETNIPLDIHLMINEPELKLQWFCFGENDMVSVHYESTKHIYKALEIIKSKGAKAFVAINPGTPISVCEPLLDVLDGILVMTVNPGFAGAKLIPSTLPKITEAKRYNKIIEVDGNVSFENAIKMKEAGADIFVAGTSSVFHKDFTLAEGIRNLRKTIE